MRQGLSALKSGDVAAFGRLDVGLARLQPRRLREQLASALDALIEAAEAAPGFLGGKLSGAAGPAARSIWCAPSRPGLRRSRAHGVRPQDSASRRRSTSATPPTVPSASTSCRPALESVSSGQRPRDTNSTGGRPSMLWARVLADLIVVLHAAYVSFVVFGLAAILLGVVFRWRWVRNVWFRGPSDGDRDRRRRVALRHRLPTDRLGRPAQEAGWADRVRRRLSRPLGTPVDLLPRRSVGFHPAIHRVRPCGAGCLHPGTPAPFSRDDPSRPIAAGLSR